MWLWRVCHASPVTVTTKSMAHCGWLLRATNSCLCQGLLPSDGSFCVSFFLYHCCSQIKCTSWVAMEKESEEMKSKTLNNIFHSLMSTASCRFFTRCWLCFHSSFYVSFFGACVSPAKGCTCNNGFAQCNKLGFRLFFCAQQPTFVIKIMQCNLHYVLMCSCISAHQQSLCLAYMDKKCLHTVVSAWCRPVFSRMLNFGEQVRKCRDGINCFGTKRA
jgi:hypothetical protein